MSFLNKSAVTPLEEFSELKLCITQDFEQLNMLSNEADLAHFVR